MAKRKKKLKLNNKLLLTSGVISILGLVGLLYFYPNYVAQKNLNKAISENKKLTEEYDYSGTKVKDTGSSQIVTYSKLGTGFEFEYDNYNTAFKIDSSNWNKLPTLIYDNKMPYNDSIIEFKYVNSDNDVTGGFYSDLNTVSDLRIITTKNISVGGYPAQIIEAEEKKEGYMDGDSGYYAYHIFVIVNDVKQGVRYSSKRIEKVPKKFVIHGSTGNTTDERAKSEIYRRVNEIIPTIKFLEN